MSNSKLNDFVPDKKKAALTATAEQVFEESRAIISPLAQLWPQGAGALNVLLASAGFTIKYKQEVLNQFTSFLMDNPDVFTEQVVSSKEFQDGLVVFINSYFKLRSEKKLALARKVFYDFGLSKEKPLYPLERYDDTLEKISESGLRFLGFIHTQIPKIKDDYVNEQMRSNSNEGDRETFYETYTNNKPLSFFINEYIKREADLYARTKSDMYAKAESDKRTELSNQFSLSLTELEYHGIVRSFTGGGIGWDAVPTSEHGLTEYGRMFISIIKPEVD